MVFIALKDASPQRTLARKETRGIITNYFSCAKMLQFCILNEIIIFFSDNVV